MRWRLFSRKKGEKKASKWRLLTRPEADAADLLAMPGAVVEGRIASRYLLSGGAGAESTLILQWAGKRGVLVGAEVTVDEEGAETSSIDVCRMPRSGRGGLSPAGAHSLAQILLDESDDFTAHENADDDLAVLLYTSGTVGKPKGVMLSHGNFLADCKLMDELCPMNPEDRIVGVLPLFHVFGLTNVLMAAVFHGSATALVPQYSPTNLLETLARDRATALLATPTMIVHLLRAQRRKKLPLPGTLRFCISGAAPLPKETIQEFESVFGAPLMEGYGLTETTSAACLNVHPTEKPGCVGRPPAGIEVRIFGEELETLPADSVGEIGLKGPNVTRGYYNLPEETASAFHDGWFLTGDVGYLDDEGGLYITDRKKELIIKGGFNISPREIEDVLLSSPGVVEAAVIGVRREEREAIKAFLVTRKGTTEAQILDYCKEHLAGYKVPNMVEFRDVLPKSLTGKVLKKELQEGWIDDRILERTDGTGDAADGAGAGGAPEPGPPL
ncbi:MAG: AMP-binding protein [Planctomycetota bacterium]|jgi:long-chain acyl-CoA synthetase